MTGMRKTAGCVISALKVRLWGFWLSHTEGEELLIMAAQLFPSKRRCSLGNHAPASPEFIRLTWKRGHRFPVVLSYTRRTVWRAHKTTRLSLLGDARATAGPALPSPFGIGPSAPP